MPANACAPPWSPPATRRANSSPTFRNPLVFAVVAAGALWYKVWKANQGKQAPAIANGDTTPSDALSNNPNGTNSEGDRGSKTTDQPAQLNENNLDKLPEKKGNKASQDAGYIDAHDAKAGRGDSKVNIYNDKTTGQKWLWDGKKGSEKEIL